MSFNMLPPPLALSKKPTSKKKTPTDTYIHIPLNDDVDSMDTEYIKSMPIKPHDQTSNQAAIKAL